MGATVLRPEWIFDGSGIPDPMGYGERAVGFLRQLRHPKSRAPGRAFQLDAWQERVVRRIYGPCHDDGRRIVRQVVLMLPRGNRKTSLAAGLALLHTIGPEMVPRGQVISAAADKKQALIAYEEITGIIEHDARLSTVARMPSRNQIINSNFGTTFESISGDAGTQHGRTPNFVLADELHAWKKRELWDVLKTGLVKTPGSLIIIPTTAGRGQENIAYEVVDHARKVARGEIDDPATLPILFEASQSADWRDESIWHAVNPGLAHGYPDLDGLRQLAREAEARPGDREAFRQLHLNVWLDHSADPFVEMSIYDHGGEPIDEATLERQPCWIAVDVGLTNDLTAVVAAFRDDDDGYLALAWFFCPEENLRKRADRDGVPYPRWAEEGHLIPTPGSVIEYAFVEQHIRDLCDRFDVREIAFDPAYAQPIMGPLTDDGFPTATMRQGWVTMGPAIKELERAIVGRRFRHGGHPVLRWNFANVAVETDKAGNKAFHKGRSKDRIDGAVAAAMAVARAASGERGGFIYADAEARPEGIILL